MPPHATFSQPDVLPLAAPVRSGADGTRFHGLDWLRAGATLLVVMLHAGLAYTLTPWPGLAWPTFDPRPSPFVDALCWWIDGFIMPLFFVLSGFVAAQLFEQRGSDGFLKHRARRLLLPLAFACVTILPLSLYACLLGWAAEGKVPLKRLRSLKFQGGIDADLWGVAHLWFLEYLFVFCLAAWAIHRVAYWYRLAAAQRAARVERSGDRLDPRRAARPPWGRCPAAAKRGALSEVVPFALAALSAGALWWDPQLVIGFRHAWYPLPANLLYYAPCFCGGWWLFRAHRAGMDVTHRCEARLALSCAAFALLLPLLRGHVASELHGAQRAALVGLFVTFAWLAVTGWFGACLKYLDRRPPRAVRYFAEASFWVYLFHHPVVELTQASLIGAGASAAAKFGVVTLAGATLPLLTYHVLVRGTWVGLLLNGRRLGVADSANAQSTSVEALPQRKAA